MPTVVTDITGVDWPTLAHLIEDAGLGRRDPKIVENVFKGSFVASFIYEKQRLVGAGRAISDGVTSSAIYDVVVAPSYQGRGVGRLLMEDLLARLPSRSVMLLSVPQQRGFYTKLGFRLLKTAMLKHENPEYWIANGYAE